MAAIKRFEEIISWQMARDLNKRIGNLIDSGKFKNSYRLINQIEGSAGSIMDNIAEGFERSGNREFVQFLYIAKGSCGELRSQLCRAFDLHYLAQNEFDELNVEALKLNGMIQRFIDYLVTSEMKGSKYKCNNTANKTPSESGATNF